MSQNLGFIASVFLQSIRDSCVSGFSTPWEHIVLTARRKWWNHLLHLCTSVASLVSQNTEEFKRSRLGYDFRGFFSCTHLKGTLCVTVSRWFFCRTFSLPFLVFPLFPFLPFLSLPFPLCLLKQYLVNPWANSHHLLVLAVIVVFILAEDSFVFQNVTLLLAERTMISDKLP